MKPNHHTTGRAVAKLLASAVILGASPLVAGNETIQEDMELLAEDPQPLPPGLALPQTPTSLRITLEAGLCEVQERANGVVLREKLDQSNRDHVVQTPRTGQPDISTRCVDVLLPFDADLKTIDLRYTGLEVSPLLPVPVVRPVGLPGTTDEETLDGAVDEEAAAGVDARGRDAEVYGADRLFPELPVVIERSGKLRQYRYVRLEFSPFQWNPRTGQVVRNRTVEVELTWERATVAAAQAKWGLSDPVVRMADLERFVNYLDSSIWYQLGSIQFRRNGTYDYVIIVKQSTRSASSQLANFVSHKQSLGYSPVVVSVEAIAACYTGLELADKIRNFLIDKHCDWGINYALLIGDPDPYNKYVSDSGDPEATADTCASATWYSTHGDQVGSVPMKMAWPRGDGWETMETGDACPTDHYYGDLSDDWDVDGDGYAAAHDDDYERITYTVDTGSHDYTLTRTDYGIDFDMEVLVGRLPYEDSARVDTVLSRSINYESRDLVTNPQGTRKRVYLAMSFFSDDADYSFLGRDIHTDHLAGLRGITLYEPGAYYSHDIDLEDEALVDKWTSKGAGMVIWSGHGNNQLAKIRHDDSHLMHTDYTSSLGNTPCFIFQGSCKNAQPELSPVLAHDILEDVAVATVAGTRNSWYSDDQEDFGTAATIGDVGYWVARSYANGWRAGWAVKSMRCYLDDPFDAGKWMQNAMTYNLYGEPTIRFKWEE